MRLPADPPPESIVAICDPRATPAPSGPAGRRDRHIVQRRLLPKGLRQHHRYRAEILVRLTGMHRHRKGAVRERELLRLRGYDCKVVVVECTWADLRAQASRRCKSHPNPRWAAFSAGSAGVSPSCSSDRTKPPARAVARLTPSSPPAVAEASRVGRGDSRRYGGHGVNTCNATRRPRIELIQQGASVRHALGQHALHRIVRGEHQIVVGGVVFTGETLDQAIQRAKQGQDGEGAMMETVTRSRAWLNTRTEDHRHRKP